MSGVLQYRWTRGTGIDVRAREPRIRRDENTREGTHTADSVHRSDLCLGFESASYREIDLCDDMKAILEDVEECAGKYAGICTLWECLMELAWRTKVVGDDREEGVEIGIYLLPEDVLRVRVRRIT